MTADEARTRLEEVVPRLYESATEQDGSRFLQWRLSEGIGEDWERDRIYDAALSSSAKLACDVFGNFVMQKLFERGTPDQRRCIVGKLQGEIYNLSTHKYACRVMQRMLEILPHEEQVNLVSELEGKVLDCVENMHGNHVVQIMVKVMSLAHIDFIVNAVSTSSDRMASHMYGCRVIQRLLERCPSDQVASLVGRVIQGAGRLATDRHGNYVVQCVLEHGRPEEKRKIIDTIRSDLVYYSKNKVSSNVVEKCFAAVTIGDDVDFLSDERQALYRTFLGHPGDKGSPLNQLVNDKFGNYTVQSVIKHSRGSDREVLKDRLNAMEPELRTQTGKHIMNCLNKLEGSDD